MKKMLSIFMALAMLFCLSANLFTFAADEPAKNSKKISVEESVKGSKQISVNSTSKIKKQVLVPAIINVLKVTSILACGAVSSAIAGNYYYEKGYQVGRDDNLLNPENIKTTAEVTLTSLAVLTILYKWGVIVALF